ncbi:hypothetical protein C8F04DRAFT_1128861 [Mycena alexandri]|uniref:MYND-type domain-containing protein n=1 Tax=Mycena alexandri TaxID=1745969 RepID=A0AAD6SCM1_9AGAR|nr:hypothetical protein C8F04DRAFT_1128861 [Mycena alexandri]
MASTPRSLKSCNNPSCSKYNVLNKESLLKCAQCSTATYCNRECQRQHWPDHKQYCKVWAATASKNGEGVRDIKKKMGDFLFLLRGVQEYVDELFEYYIGVRREDPEISGCIEFLFEKFEQLDDAISVLRSLPVVGEHVFQNIPNSPGWVENPKGLPITLRKRTPKRERQFLKAIHKRMEFAPNHPETRPNLVNLLRMVGSSERMLVVCVCVRLEGTFNTNSYDFFYKDLDWIPEEVPAPSKKRLAIEPAYASPPIHRMVEFDMD